MPKPYDEPLQKLRESWLASVRVPQRYLLVAAFVLAVVVGLLVARSGTTRARVGAAASMGAIAIALALGSQVARRRLGDSRRTLTNLVARVDAEKASRALRALSVVETGGPFRGTSEELAALHVARTLAALPNEKVIARAEVVGSRLQTAAIVVAVAAAALFVGRFWSVLEGGDVLIARHGVAPLAMRWLDEEGTTVHARPPEYLHSDERAFPPTGAIALPHGTLLTFRGLPLHSGRALALTDGVSEVPFVDDGSGGVVARWPMEAPHKDEPTRLRVVARFGAVVIEEPSALEVTDIADRAPVVTLEGAPREVPLATCAPGDPACSWGSGGDEGETGDIPIRYEASDDHGLREVHLVLRSGTREERRVLARLDGETRFDRGGHVLRARDPFLRKSHAPVEVRVEAKDNDPLTGPKWGASAAITIIPPDVGEPEAKRMDALRGLRDALVDTLAGRIAREVPRDPTKRAGFTADDKRAMEDDSERIETALTASYAGVRVPGRLQSLLRGSLRKLRVATDVEQRALSGASHAKVVGASEHLVLVVDAVIRGLDVRDSRDASRQLADVADELALGAAQMVRPEERDRGGARADASVRVLEGGFKSMKRLGALGRDIGGIVEGNLLRVARAKTAADYPHMELAAKDLAARLRQPDPSFGSQGRSGRGGGESGGGRGTPGDEAGEPDDAQRAFNEAAQELERLAQDHAGEMGKVEQALNDAQSEDDLHAMEEEARKHAENVREAAKPLPSVGGGSDSWTSKGSAAKEHAEQMAKSLENGRPGDAVQSGRNAIAALDEAKRIAQRERWFGTANEAEKKIDDSKKKLEGEVKWAEQKLDELRKKAAERASKQLGEQGDAEDKIADRAQKLGDKGRDSAGLPQPALESLDDAEKEARKAAQALKQGQADKALEHQREAQRKLEMAKQSMENNSDEGNRGEGGDADQPSMDHADIPKADAHKGPEDFRKRVVKGLGRPSNGHLKDAVRRYAEGLLR